MLIKYIWHQGNLPATKLQLPVSVCVRECKWSQQIMSNTTKCAKSKNPEKLRCGGCIPLCVYVCVCLSDAINMEKVKFINSYMNDFWRNFYFWLYIIIIAVHFYLGIFQHLLMKCTMSFFKENDNNRSILERVLLEQIARGKRGERECCLNTQKHNNEQNKRRQNKNCINR